jgi:hypothetical protein
MTEQMMIFSMGQNRYIRDLKENENIYNWSLNFIKFEKNRRYFCLIFPYKIHIMNILFLDHFISDIQKERDQYELNRDYYLVLNTFYQQINKFHGQSLKI